MRKIILITFITLCSFYSVQLMAEVLDCDLELKGNKEFKSLYGLCVAYWSADEEAHNRLLDLYQRKAVKLGAPDELLYPPGYGNGEGDTCPCWNIDTVRQVLACGGYQYFGGYPYDEFSDQSEVAYLNDIYLPVLVVGPTDWVSHFDGNECQVHFADPAMVLNTYLPVSETEESACRIDIGGLIDSWPAPDDCLTP